MSSIASSSRTSPATPLAMNAAGGPLVPEGTVLALPTSVPRDHAFAFTPGFSSPPEVRVPRRRRVEAGPSGPIGVAEIPPPELPKCPACPVFLRALCRLRGDREELEQIVAVARRSLVVMEGRLRQGIENHRHLEGDISSLRLSYDNLRNKCRVLQQRVDSSSDPAFLLGDRLVLSWLRRSRANHHGDGGREWPLFFL